MTEKGAVKYIFKFVVSLYITFSLFSLYSLYEFQR